MRRICFEIRLWLAATILEWALDLMPLNAKPDTEWLRYMRGIREAAKALGEISEDAKGK